MRPNTIAVSKKLPKHSLHGLAFVLCPGGQLSDQVVNSELERAVV